MSCVMVGMAMRECGSESKSIVSDLVSVSVGHKLMALLLERSRLIIPQLALIKT